LDGFSFLLFLRFFENNALAQSRIELRELNFALSGFLVLARPENMLGLRGLQLDKTVL